MRTFRRFAALPLVAMALATTVRAQSPVESHERAIWDAYQNLRGSDALTFEMTGAEISGKNATPVHAILYWKRSMDARTRTDSRVEVELDVYQAVPKGEVLTMRIVGDGVNLYRYDLVRREVSTTTYGFYGKDLPEKYVGSDAPKLLSQLRAATPGVAAYLVRLVAEMNPAGSAYVARFTKWVPGMMGYSLDEVPIGPRKLNGPVQEDDTVTDPITGRVFVRGSDNFVFFGYEREAPERTVAFDLYDADTSEENELWEVRSVAVSIRTADRIVGLTLAPSAGTAPEWAFVPYSGADATGFRPVTRGR